MKKILVAIFLSSSLFITYSFANQSYVMPPTASTAGHVPVISDEMMEQCVKTYNEAQWLAQKIQTTRINQYSASDVNWYNEQVNKVNSMTSWFNTNCAGKQSRSACEAANKLNMQQGLPTQSCR